MPDIVIRYPEPICAKCGHPPGVHSTKNCAYYELLP